MSRKVLRSHGDRTSVLELSITTPPFLQLLGPFEPVSVVSEPFFVLCVCVSLFIYPTEVGQERKLCQHHPVTHFIVTWLLLASCQPAEDKRSSELRAFLTSPSVSPPARSACVGRGGDLQ